MKNLDIGLLRTFLHVAETGSMTFAAQRLHMTQGAVSQQIKRLEQMMDRRVLDRGKGGVHLTVEGERLLIKVRAMVEMNDEILSALTITEVTGTIRIGVPHDLMVMHLPNILPAFVKTYPSVEISLMAGSSTELTKSFDSGLLDLAIIEEPATHARGELLVMERPVWVARRDGVAWQKRPLPLCLVSETCAFKPTVMRELARASIDWRNVVDYPSIEAITATVQADLAVTALLPSTVPPGLDILGSEAGLPLLDEFAISLRLPAHGASAACLALAEAIRLAYAVEEHDI
ncbi:LysR family transcriptional regulator [Undibacterium sp. Ji49W]|uniref:LysR family transcriptional regulator n=1 Tax=Undibacterium sp. Ji49W TaxID=3413040 RepID=UPI003BF2CD7D